MNNYPTNDGFKDEREEPEDSRNYGHWGYISKPCPECGGRLQQKSTDFSDTTEVEECCDDCEFYTIYYE